MGESAIAVLRVSARNFRVHGFIAEHGLSVDRVWRQGERDRRGAPQEASGFNLCIAGDISPRVLARELSAFLASTRKMRSALRASDASVEVDIGLMIESVAPASVEFPSDLLAELAREGIRLRITGYPCSEDQRDEHAT